MLGKFKKKSANKMGKSLFSSQLTAILRCY